MILLLVFLALFCGSSYGSPLDLTSDPRSLGPRIIGGVDAPEAYSPHSAALLHGSPNVFMICGGSIVTRKHILTAAHCITPFVQEDGKLSRSFHGRVGSNIWHLGGVKVYFESHFIHPEWDEEIFKNDAGILCLTRRLEFNDQVSMIRLNFAPVDGGEDSYVTGWGRTGPRIDDYVVNLAPIPDELQLLYVQTLTPEQCAAGLNATPQWAATVPPLDPAVELCTLHSPGHGMCQGDSGSALVSVSSGLQSGVVSWGFPCAQGAPDVHTRVSGVEEFIRSVLVECSCFDY